MKLLFLAALLFSAGAMPGSGGTDKPDTPLKYEQDYVDFYCEKWRGEIEYVLPDRTRVDCLTNDSAIEFDWCKKWAESIGQSTYYVKMTGKQPKAALICKADELRFIERYRTTTGLEPIVIKRL